MPRAYAVCWVLALIAVWLPHFPVGVDLPQHANLFRLWVDLASGPFEYRAIYYSQLFTPYLLPYLIALPFTKFVGALFATKVLLTFMVFGTPLFLTRFLRVVGAEPAFGLVGFVVAFGYCYLWGFISCALAIPLMFAYLSEFEAQGACPAPWAIVRTALLGAALFFSHGITFGAAVLIAGASFLLRGRWFFRYRAALHFLPLCAIAISWLALRHEHSSAPPNEWFDRERAVLLFSGAFMPFADEAWAKVAAGAVAMFLVVARPKLSLRPARSLPLAVTTLCFVALPNWLASTWLVATRFCVFIHAFAPAVLVPRTSDRLARAWRPLLFGLVAAFLVLLNVRLYSFNRELLGFREVMASIPPGTDLQTRVPETDNTSPTFGASQFGQIPAWVSAERGGLIANDSAVSGYYQLPIRRKDMPALQDYPYVIAHGDPGVYGGSVMRMSASAAGPAALVRQAGEWLLFKRAVLETEDFIVVRHGQDWGDLRLNHEVEGGPLLVAKVAFATGLGTHARSLVRLRFKRAALQFRGACGMDDGAGATGHAVFRIRASRGRTLFDSGIMSGGMPARRFAVPLEGQRELVLEVERVEDVRYAHADWVDLSLD